MKKEIILLFLAALIFSGCGQSTSNSSPNAAPNPSAPEGNTNAQPDAGSTNKPVTP